MWHIHILTGTLVTAAMLLSLAGAEISPVILIPFGVLTCWCLLVSGVRIIQSVTGCHDLDRLAEELKKED